MASTLQIKSMQSEIKINKTDDIGENKRKRSETSSASELDTSTNSDAQDCKKGKKKKSKKMASIKEKPVKESNPVSNTEIEKDSVAAQLKALNMKMSNVMTKDDKSLKKMMKSLFHEMKEDFLQSVFHRIELLESSIYEKDKENDKLKEQVKTLNAELESQKEETSTLRRETDEANEKADGKINALEQYGRRNNIRIDGVYNRNNETPMMTSNLVVNMLNEKINGLNLKVSDIDISHRVGKVKSGGKRQIIVKFMSRMTKDNLMYQKHQLKNTGIYVNEDLTSVSSYVLACLRKKLPDEIDQAWSQNGCLWYKNKMGHKHTVEYKEYKHWIGLDWIDDVTSVKSTDAAETNPEAGTSVPEAMG